MTPDLTPAALDELAGKAAEATRIGWGSRVPSVNDAAIGQAFNRAADPATVAALVDEVKRLRGVVERVEVMLTPPRANREDQCVRCGDRRLHHYGQGKGCHLCGFCGGFKQRTPDVTRDALLAALGADS